MIPATLETVLFGAEIATFSTFAGAVLAETLLSNQTKAAIGFWVAEKMYENFFKN